MGSEEVDRKINELMSKFNGSEEQLIMSQHLKEELQRKEWVTHVEEFFISKFRSKSREKLTFRDILNAVEEFSSGNPNISDGASWQLTSSTIVSVPQETQVEMYALIKDYVEKLTSPEAEGDII